MLRKKLPGTDKVLGAYTVTDGVAIGMARQGNIHYEGVVLLIANGQGETALVINEDKLAELNGKVIVKKYEDPVPYWEDKEN